MHICQVCCVLFQMTEYLDALRLEAVSSEVVQRALPPIEDLVLEEVLGQVSEAVGLSPLTSTPRPGMTSPAGSLDLFDSPLLSSTASTVGGVSEIGESSVSVDTPVVVAADTGSENTTSATSVEMVDDSTIHPSTSDMDEDNSDDISDLAITHVSFTFIYF